MTLLIIFKSDPSKRHLVHNVDNFEKDYECFWYSKWTKEAKYQFSYVPIDSVLYFGPLESFWEE